MNLTAFQKRKIEHVFQIFYDVNGDNIIQWKDFELALHKICEVHEWKTGDNKYKEATKTMWDVWQGLKKLADNDKNDSVSLDEWLNMWNEVMKDGKSPLPEWINNYRDFMFSVNDVSEDNIIDRGEFLTVYQAFGVSSEDCEYAFDKISNNGTITITKEEHDRLWLDYFFTNDRESNANYLFGMKEFC